MSGNMIWRGRIDNQPHSLNLPVVGAYLPGTFVVQSGDTLAQAANAEGNYYILGEFDIMGRSVATAYSAGETAIAYEVKPRDVFQARLAAATYAKGDALTINASGQLAAAGAGAEVVAFFDDVPGAYAAGDLADVIISNGQSA